MHGRPMSLAGKRALVTGAGSGIGRAVAVRLALGGARVGLIGRRESALRETEDLILERGGIAHVAPCDVSREEQVRRAVSDIAAALAGIDSVIGVAGIELVGQGEDRIDRLDLTTWQQTLDVNLTGMFLTCKYGVRALIAAGGGSITLTGSPCGDYGVCRGQPAYSASKAGVHGLVRVLAADLASEHIRVNGVIPGFIETPITAPVFEDRAWLERAEAAVPLRRAGGADEAAHIYAWLASDEAAYVTGAFFTVDGGMTAV